MDHHHRGQLGLCTMPRLRGAADHFGSITAARVIGSHAVRKPGAFARYRFRARAVSVADVPGEIV